KLSKDLTQIFFACSVGLGVVALYVMFALQQFDSRFLAAASWVFAIIYVSIGRILIRGLKGLMYRAGLGLRRVAVIGGEEIASDVVRELNQRKELGYKVVGQHNVFSAQLIPALEKLNLDEILFTNPRANEKEALRALNFCNLRHIVFKYSADLFSAYSANMSVSPLAGVPMVELKRTPLDGWGRVAKRIVDILISLFAITALAPLMILFAVIILLETGRPVIYKNERVGIRGQKFFTFKFRSMFQADCTGPQFGRAGLKAETKEKDLIEEKSVKTGPIYKIADDPRVTKFGRFIRRWSMDELPQFFNVLIGDMSIVGPRPHQPREVEQYEKEYPTVFTLKPGITGMAQISGRSDLSFEEEMKLDIFYIERWSMFLDLIIFIKTPFVIFKRRKAL
ncbi:MAG: sugar transferase, partial [Candidatus Magasanikbacteria bacterium]|nr:sugar transferase [Candidatus Magasanikbacteria bacterium]